MIGFAIEAFNLERTARGLLNASRVIDKDLRANVRKAGLLVRRQMKQEAPVRRGSLRKSITMAIRKVSGGTFDVEVGPEKRRRGSHGHLVERGTTARTWRSGKSTGRMPANPFVQRTADGTAEQVFSILGETGKAI